MSDVKKILKLAKVALDEQNYVVAVTQARIVLNNEPENYLGKVFLGRGLEKQDKIDEAVASYQDATRIRPDDELAWKGLCQVLESQGYRAVGKLIQASVGLAQVYVCKDDQDQCQTVVDKLVAFSKTNGTQAEYKQALEILLPSGPVYEFLEGRLQKPSYTYTKLAEITETEEENLIKKGIEERRTRLGSSLSSVTNSVTHEVFANSTLESLYQNVIDWTSDDEERRLYEEKLLQRAYNHLCVLYPEDKPLKREQVIKLAHDMIVIKHPFPLAWHVELEWSDMEDLVDRDRETIHEYLEQFPGSGLAKAFEAAIGSTVRNVPPEEHDRGNKANSDVANAPQPIAAEDRLILVADSLQEGTKSALLYRLAAHIYLCLDEYEAAVETARKAQCLLATEKAISGLSLLTVTDALDTDLATALVYYQSPKNHPEAQRLLDEILRRRPNATGALLGTGLILEEQDRFEDAKEFLERASKREPNNIKIVSEAAWCNAMAGKLQEGFDVLQNIYEQTASSDSITRELRAQIVYRIGQCLWELQPDRKKRKDRQGSYSFFLSAIKLNAAHASAYTSLGIYYGQYANDKKRARQCFQKAFELSASEVIAAEYLARGFADDQEWDIVELVAQRVADSAQLRPKPGSKRKGISWPFAALGVVHMNRQEYSKSVSYFQSALRISPDHYDSWVGLGESYHSSGRYNAARRTLEHALDLSQKSDTDQDAWFASYMLANVHRELGDYHKAILRYEAVLIRRPHEFGILMAVLETCLASAHHNLVAGFFGEAVANASKALMTAQEYCDKLALGVNLWKAIGDACSVFAAVPIFADTFPVNTVREVIKNKHSEYADPLSKDNVSLEDLNSDVPIIRVITSAILAYKAAVNVSLHDIHAQAVAWYNLGWAEFKASTIHSDLPGKTAATATSRLHKAAVRCFKRANELEARNADFWNALGVVTTDLNPKVAQHALIRSLYLDERSARAWTNLGTFYLVQDDYDLAHEAFRRAQSNDPEYSLAWLGQGLIALLAGRETEALSHFVHAAELDDTSAPVVERQYITAVFDSLVRSESPVSAVRDVSRSLFAAQRLQHQSVERSKIEHLKAVHQERIGDFDNAMSGFEAVSKAYETQYEETESCTTLTSFLEAKADLARSQFAAGQYPEAVEASETVLTLSDEQDNVSMGAVEWQKLRLSSHIVQALANHHMTRTENSMSSFYSTLEESQGSANVACMLAQTLWNKGNDSDRVAAKEQLFDCLEKHPEHIDAMLLLGSISVLEGDRTTAGAVLEDLSSLRTSSKTTALQYRRIDMLLRTPTQQDIDTDTVQEQDIDETLTSIMLRPYEYHAWADLAEMGDDETVTKIALSNAEMMESTPDSIESLGLAEAYAKAGSIAEAQRSLLLNPTPKEVWEVLQAEDG